MADLAVTMTESPSEPQGQLDGIGRYLTEVVAAAHGGFYRLALAGALTIPDIMAALGSDNGRTSGPLYQEWFDEHAGPLFGLAGRLREETDPRVREIMEHQLAQASYRPPISGHQCWLFRCAVLHQARGRQRAAETTRLAFIEPGSTTTSVHLVGVTDGSGNTVLQVDLGEFCRTMVQAAVEWLDANHDNPTVQANLAEVMTVYPDGAGGIAGVPVVM